MGGQSPHSSRGREGSCEAGVAPSPGGALPVVRAPSVQMGEANPPPPASSSEKRQKGDSVTAGTQPALLSSSAPGMTHVSTLDLRVPSFHLCFPRDETDSPTLLPLEKVPGKGFDWPNTGDCNKLWTNHGG